jgi:glutamate-1-semialdehyde 2,1-aminomutase
VAALEQLLTAERLDQLFDRGERLRRRLAAVAAGYGLSVTGWGSILGIHAVGGQPRSVADLAGADHRIAELLFHHLLASGFYVARRGFVALSLPVTDEQLDDFVAAFTAGADDLASRAILLECLTNRSR